MTRISGDSPGGINPSPSVDGPRGNQAAFNPISKSAQAQLSGEIRHKMEGKMEEIRDKLENLLVEIAGKFKEKPPTSWMAIASKISALRGELLTELRKYGGDTSDAQINNGFGYITRAIDNMEKLSESIGKMGGTPDLKEQKQIFLTFSTDILSPLRAGPPPKNQDKSIEPPWK